MRDYAELIEALRGFDVGQSCPCETPDMCNENDCMVYQAADAIEELLVDNTEAFSADIISMKNAVETDVWLMVWAAEPNRKIHVQMTYDELWKIVQMERENMIKPPKGG